MSHPLLRTLISEMVGDYLEESENKLKASEVKTNDNVHRYLRQQGADHDGNLDRKTSAYEHHSPKRVLNNLKKAGWKHTPGDSYKGSPDKYEHPDGHTTISHVNNGSSQLLVKDNKTKVAKSNPHKNPNYYD